MVANTFDYVVAWLEKEREYQLKKFGVVADLEHIRNLDDGWWDNQFDNYWHRAKLLGLDVIVGRQAAAKFVATGVGMLEATIDEFGSLPMPGVSSGGNLDTLFLP
jgi:hypothetical protein